MLMASIYIIRFSPTRESLKTSLADVVRGVPPSCLQRREGPNAPAGLFFEALEPAGATGMDAAKGALRF